MTDERLRDLYERTLATRDRDAARARCVSPEAMLALVRREGTEEERLETLDHVMACDDCRRELDLLRSIEAAGAQVEGARPADEPIALWSRGRRTASPSWRRVVPFALAASLVLAVGVGVRDRLGAPGADSADVTRGEGGALALLTPAAAAYVDAGAPVTFAWRPEPGARRYLLEVLDAQGNVVLSESTADTTLVLRDTGRLAPGTEYRWWVRLAAGGDPQRASAVRRLRIRSQ